MLCRLGYTTVGSHRDRRQGRRHVWMGRDLADLAGRSRGAVRGRGLDDGDEKGKVIVRNYCGRKRDR
jgi:hypothetical protein